MLAGNYWKRFVGTTEPVDLGDLRHDMILVVTAVVLVIGWLVTLSGIAFGGHPEYLPSGVLLLGGPLIALWLRFRHFRAALYCLIAVLTMAIACFKWSAPESSAQYFMPLVIVVSSLLVSSRGVYAVAAVVAAVCVAIALAQGADWLDPAQVLTPVTLVGLTALAAWLNSRHVALALEYMESSYVRTRDLLEQLRDERMMLARTHKSLEEAYVRIEKMNYALIEAHRVAEEARRFKSEFVANVSHELRTPLNLIIGFTEMMATAPESYGGVALPGAYRGDVMAAYRNARHLRALIDDVLDLSRIEAGEMPLNRAMERLDEVIREAADMVRGFVEARGLALVLTLEPEVPPLYIDRTRIRQVLLNLLINSTRFTDRGHVGVTTRLDGDEVVVTIDDDGRGIEPARLAQAFEAFNQLDDGHAAEGSGLGLAVSKRFCELHGGRMWIESEVGSGTRVSFTLPLSGETAHHERFRWRPGWSTHNPSKEPQVLVLHDDLRVLPLLRRYIGGYQYQIAETAAKARVLIKDMLPSAVIADAAWWQLARVDAAGLDLPPHLPVVRCSLPSAKRLGVLVGATDFLAKPVTRDDLANAIGRLAEPPRTVLIVDDERDFVRLLARMLKADYPQLRVLESFGGQQGLEIAGAERPDLILLDLAMPEVDGYAFLEAMAGDPAMAATRVIIVSAPSADLETAPLAGEMRLEVAGGFSLTEMLRALQMTLAAATSRPDAALASAPMSPPIAPA